MAAFFFDTSGLVKRHVNEAGTPWVRSLTQPKAGHTIFIARITGVEVVAAITRRQNGGSLSPAQAGAILGHFRRHFVQRYNIVELTAALVGQAMLLARKHGLRGYDAVQLASMLSLHQSRSLAGLSILTFVSADGDLYRAAQAEGLAVENPINHP
jgi:predicted nucleic acid-binding protein